ncbi:hypothetical protein AB4254_11950 [Vibrio breoganii]
MTEITLSSKQCAKIKRALKALEEVRKEVDLESDEAVRWYLEDSGNLNLMTGDSHDDSGSPNFDAVIEHFEFPESTGGAW